MNDIFKLFKKRSQSGKTNLNEMLQEFNDKDTAQNNASNFDRSNQKYISISKSGRVKSKKSHHTNRVLKEELFQPSQQQQQQQQTTQQQVQSTASSSMTTKNTPNQNTTISAGTTPHYKNNHYNFNPTVNRYNTKQQNVYDQHSDNADSSRTSSASQSSLEDFNSKPINSYNIQPPLPQQQQRSAYHFPYGATRNQYY